jgi:hypothetical protein
MAIDRDTPLFTWVELTEAIDSAPAGAKGGLLEYRGGDMAMLEIMEPELDSVDRIVFAPLSALRVLEAH